MVLFLKKMVCAVVLLPIMVMAAVIVENGKCDYDIVIREGAPQTTVYSAKELADYLKKVSGAEAKIVNAKVAGRKAIYLGAHGELPKTADFDASEYAGKERFRIAELNGGDISIMGADCDANPVSRKEADFGLLFGTYEFIERFLGVRWYAPGTFGECYKPMEKVEVTGLPIDQTPAYYSRSYWPWTWNEFEPTDSLVFNRRMRAFGIQEGSSNHSMMDFYFPYHETKPEIFALRADGKREMGAFAPDTKPSQRRWIKYPQYCFTNPEFLKIYCDAIDAYYAKDPKAKFWVNMHPNEHFVHVSPDDCFNLAKCHCEKCKAMLSSKPRAGMSNLVYSFVAKVAEHVKAKYPGKKVICLAYEDYYYPPDFKLPDNVVISICVDPYMFFFGSKRYQDSFDKTLKMWSEKVNEITVWQYLMPYRDTYPYYLPNIANDWFRRYPKIKGCFIELNDTALAGRLAGREMQVNPVHKGQKTVVDLGQNHLTFIASMKAMWGAPYDVKAELERYYDLFYGLAAKPMKKYFDTAIFQWENVKNTTGNVEASFAKFSGKELYEDIYSSEVLDIMEQSLTEAEGLAPAGSIYADRIAWIRKSYFNDFCKVARAYQKEAKLSNDTILLMSKAKAPVIDGNLDDAFWKGLPEYKFRLANAPMPPPFGTTFKMAFRNDGKLYIGLRAEDPHIDSARLLCKDRDSNVYTDDSIEFFFRSDKMERPKAYRNVTINLDGVILDYDTLKGKMNREYNTNADIKVLKGKDFYNMEMAIDLAEIGIDPADENPVLRMNICRNKRSGVPQMHGLSCWIPVYGNFNNVSVLPAIRLVGQKDPASDSLATSKKIYASIQVKDEKGKETNVKEGSKVTWEAGQARISYTFPNRRSYGNLLLTGLDGADLSNSPYIEIRFRNPSEKLALQAVYSYIDSTGKTRSDWIYFCKNEKHDVFSVRAINVAKDGYSAKKRMERKEEPFKPVKLIYFAIYSHPQKSSTLNEEFMLDYVRVTGTPAGK
ncbi:MAG: DUF4838 domain-containing protein [Victivallales bacterium]|nr:DUF4838 domain-containing protein [Victivallales bacterium]